MTQATSPEFSASAVSDSPSSSENSNWLHYAQLQSHGFCHQWRSRYSPLQPLRRWLDSLEVRNVKTARRIAKWIPAQCPFERDVTLLGRTVAHIPPLCKLNPLYEQLVTLRFRALCYLADECGEDIRSYC
ncbi:MAG: Mo-dependent nitrogenase C-terminal domain-containing protein [Elainella sp.]